MPRGVAQKIISGFNSTAKVTKKLTWSSESPLKAQMWQMFCEKDLRLPGEQGPSCASTSTASLSPAPTPTSFSSPRPYSTAPLARRRTTPPLALASMPSSLTCTSSTTSHSTIPSATEVSSSSMGSPPSSSTSQSDNFDVLLAQHGRIQMKPSTQAPKWHGMDWRLGLGLGLGVLGLIIVVQFFLLSTTQTNYFGFLLGNLLVILSVLVFLSLNS